MFSGPRFTKPTHSYGESFGDGTSSPVADGTSSAEEPQEGDWAGKGFGKPYEEPEQ